MTTPVLIDGRELKAELMTWKKQKEYKRAVMDIAVSNSKVKEIYEKAKDGTPDEVAQAMFSMASFTDAYREMVMRIAYGLTQEQIDNLPALAMEDLISSFIELNTPPVIEGDGGKKELTARIIALAK